MLALSVSNEQSVSKLIRVINNRNLKGNSIRYDRTFMCACAELILELTAMLLENNNLHQFSTQSCAHHCINMCNDLNKIYYPASPKMPLKTFKPLLLITLEHVGLRTDKQLI